MENNTMPQTPEMSIEEREYNALEIETRKALLAYRIAEEKWQRLETACDLAFKKHLTEYRRSLLKSL